MRIVSLGRKTLHILDLNSVTLTRTDGQSLELHSLALVLDLSSPLSVRLDTVDELFTRAGVVDVFETDVDALLKVAVADLLVDDDADCGFGDVVDNAGLAVVDLVGHTLLLSAVVLDVHDVADSVCLPVVVLSVCMSRLEAERLEVGLHEGAEAHHTLLAEVAREPVVVVSLFARCSVGSCERTHSACQRGDRLGDPLFRCDCLIPVEMGRESRRCR